jgi:hypothetical protein
MRDLGLGRRRILSRRRSWRSQDGSKKNGGESGDTGFEHRVSPVRVLGRYAAPARKIKPSMI